MAKDEYKHYEEIHRLPEYQAILYTKKDSVKKIWQCRIKPRNSAAIIKSTKTTSLSDAIWFAHEWFDVVRTAEKLGVSVRLDPSFSSVWSEFHKKSLANGTVSVGRLKTLSSVIEKYPVQFLGHVSVRQITLPLYEAYKEWRRDYWISGPGLSELRNNPNKRHAKVPQPATLDYEHAGFIQIMRWATRSGYMQHTPDFESYKHAKGIKRTRGGGISPSQWARLVNRLWEKAFNPTNKAGEPVKLNGPHTHERQVLYFITVFMGGSMIRPSEAYRLRWRNIRWKPSDRKDGVEDLLIRVPMEIAKTKEQRIAIGTNRCAEYMRRWYSLTEYSDPDDFVFPRYGGERISTVAATFMKVLAELKITHDHENVKITLYSCRHYAITAAMERGRPILEVALYAGTSVSHIEKRYYRADLERKSSEFALQQYFSVEEIRDTDG